MVVQMERRRGLLITPDGMGFLKEKLLGLVMGQLRGLLKFQEHNSQFCSDLCPHSGIQEQALHLLSGNTLVQHRT